MKNTKNALLLVLVAALCFAVISCGTGSGGGGAAASTDSGFGEGVPFTGNWYSYDDQDGNGGSSTITMEQVEVDGQVAYHFTGSTTTQYQYGFVGFGVEPKDSDGEPVAELQTLLQSARAISFMFIGDGKRMTVKYSLSTVRDYAVHEYHFTTDPGVATRIEVPIRMFQQPGWGAPVRMNTANATEIQWQTHEGWRPGSFECTVWDVRVHP